MSLVDEITGLPGKLFDQFNFFGGGQNPANPALLELNKAPEIVKKYYGPYTGQGREAYSQLQPVYNQMMSSPNEYIANMMAKYQPSAYYTSQKNKGLQALANTAAAGGSRGSVSDIEAQSDLSRSLLNQDMQNWLKNAMGYQNMGLSGKQRLYDTGFDAIQNLTGDLSNIYGTQMSLADQGRREAEAQRRSGLGGLTSLLGAGLGGLIGGPLGAGTGLGIGGAFGGLFSNFI